MAEPDKEEPMTDDAAMRAAALKVVSEYTAMAYDETRAEAAKTMGPGDRKSVRSPWTNGKIGTITMTDPEPSCVVTDQEALEGWVREHYPEQLESHFDIIGSEREVVDVLFEHAPHLIKRRSQVNSDWLKSVKAESAKLGVVVGPGGEADIQGLDIKTPSPVVRCRPADGALDEVIELFHTGHLRLDNLRALPAGESQ